jgi:hypothetical protein
MLPPGMMPQLEARVRQEIRQRGTLKAYHHLLAENDAAIARLPLDNGRVLTAARSAIHRELARHWAAAQHRQSDYRRPFALVALGGTGRAEVCPASDLDFAFLFDDELDGNPFLLELQRQVLHSNEFAREYGFTFQPFPFNLDDARRLTGKQLNSFLDLEPLHDPDGLAARFRDRIRATFDPFEHFLHVRTFWRDQFENGRRDENDPRERLERLDEFDIKKEGLRVFLAGIWTLAGARFLHSHEVYALLDDPRDLQAYDFLLRLRCFLHRRRRGPFRPRPDGSHPEDILGFAEFQAFGELLGPKADEEVQFEFARDIRARLVSAGRRVDQFTRGVLERELELGRETRPGSGLICGAGARLHHVQSGACRTPEEKSRAALALLLAAQRHGLEIDPTELQTTFRNAGDWLVLVPEVSALFYEQRGSLADTFRFLSRIDGAQDRLFPGYSRFEASFDKRVLDERRCLRGTNERTKLEVLERWLAAGREQLTNAVNPERITGPGHAVSIEIEAALLDADHLAALKLALKTKRLPLTPEDEFVRHDTTRPPHERLSSGFSGIPLADYFEPHRSHAGFTEKTIEITLFLLANRRAFQERTETGIMDAQEVSRLDQLCQHDEQRLRALYVFTVADRAGRPAKSAGSTRRFSIRELYTKARSGFRARLDPVRLLRSLGYPREDAEVLADFGEDFFGGGYAHHVRSFGAHLLKLHAACPPARDATARDSSRDSEAPLPGDPSAIGPRVSLVRDPDATMLVVAACDYRGLAASVCGALWRRKINLEQAHFFSATNEGLVLDFFHLAPGEMPSDNLLVGAIEDAIRDRLHLGEDAEVPRIAAQVTLEDWRPAQAQYRLRAESDHDVGEVAYALAHQVYRNLGGNIFGLVARSGRGRASVSVFLTLPPEVPFEKAREMVVAGFA